MTRRIGDPVFNWFRGGLVRSVVVTETLTDEQRKAMEQFLIAETKMFLLKGALVYTPDSNVYSYVALPHPEWTPAELGDTLKAWWTKEDGNIVGTVVKETWA